jgi:hypothetical protein
MLATGSAPQRSCGRFLGSAALPATPKSARWTGLKDNQTIGFGTDNSGRAVAHVPANGGTETTMVQSDP